MSEDISLSMVSPVASCIKTRRLAILVADGVEAAPLRRLQQDLGEAGVVCKLVAPHLGAVSTSTGRQLVVDHTFANMPSIMFDAVLIPGGATSAAALCALGDAVHFVLEAYKHCKTICALNEGVQILASLGLSAGKNADQIALPAAGVLVADARRVLEGLISQELMAAIAQHRHWDRANVDAVPA